MHPTIATEQRDRPSLLLLRRPSINPRIPTCHVQEHHGVRHLDDRELLRWGGNRARSYINLEDGDRTCSTPELLPVDRGAAAWNVLFAAFIFEALLWGKSGHIFLYSFILINFYQ